MEEEEEIGGEEEEEEIVETVKISEAQIREAAKRVLARLKKAGK